MPTRQLIADRFGDHNFGDDEVPGNPTIDGILKRASCRDFDPEPVPEPLLDILLAAAFSSPSKSDLQQRTVIVVDDKAKQQRIARLNQAVGWLADAPLFMVWCSDSRRLHQIAQWRNHQFANDHLDTFMNASVDAAIAMQTFIVAAESAGLGCCPVSQIRDNIVALSAALELPEYVFPVAGLCVGWPARPPQISPRLPLSVTVHYDKYQQDDDLENKIEVYDRRREERSPTRPGQQRMIDRFGTSEHYGWSEDRSRQCAVPARTDFGEYLRKQRFKLD